MDEKEEFKEKTEDKNDFGIRQKTYPSELLWGDLHFKIVGFSFKEFVVLLWDVRSRYNYCMTYRY